ncbi:MAG: hypothetical protein R6V85_03520 [Polyangia bacterium]
MSPTEKNRVAGSEAHLFIFVFLTCSALFPVKALSDEWPDNWDWEPVPNACPVDPDADVTEQPCPDGIVPDEFGDKPLFFFLGGTCDFGQRQKQSEIRDAYRQWLGEGEVPLSDDSTAGAESIYQNDILWSQLNDAVPKFRGGETGQLILGSENVLGEGNAGIVNGEALYFRIPWNCWTGTNAGAWEALKQIYDISSSIFETYEQYDAPFNPQIYIIAHSGGGLVVRTMLTSFEDFESYEIKDFFNEPRSGSGSKEQIVSVKALQV